ncbi:MAG: ATP-binding cassette domain-containing protein [Pilosibacter sp.]
MENINMDVKEGEFLTMLGPSGCGKSTILRTIGGFPDIDDGDILIDGCSVKRSGTGEPSDSDGIPEL